MKRVILLKDVGRHKAGWGVEVEDAVATMWVKDGKAAFGPDDLPLKKGNLENYDNCNALTPAEIAAKRAKTAPTPLLVAAEPPGKE